MPDISGNPRHLSIPAGSALTVVTDFVRDLQMKSLCVSCPSPNYSFGAKPDLAVAECRDTIIYAVRWQLHDLTFRPLCRCGQELKGKRWSIAQVEGEVKRLVLEGGVRGYAFSWIMECPKADGRCETPDHNRQTYSSNEAYILRQVEEQCGRHLRRLYPVEYGYATRGGLFHFTEAYTRSLETLVVTHVPFSVLAENAKVAFRESRTSRCTRGGGASSLRRPSSPTGSSLRSLSLRPGLGARCLSHDQRRVHHRLEDRAPR